MLPRPVDVIGQRALRHRVEPREDLVLWQPERVRLQRVFADGQESHFELNVPRGTRRLLVDPEEKLLRLH